MSNSCLHGNHTVILIYDVMFCLFQEIPTRKISSKIKIFMFYVKRLHELFNK